MSRFPLLFLLLVSTAQAGWKTHVSQDDSDSTEIRASIAFAASPQFGLPTLQDAIAELEDDGHIDHIKGVVLFGGHVEPSFQREVFEQLREHAPQLLAIALESGGGTYENPKLKPLHRVFDQVVLQTATVEAIDKQLAAIGKRVSGASHEKLWFRKTEEPLEVHFFLYLSVEDI
ncbi:MAG: hypothetical protein QNJ05_16515 [Woeseiaceae bacterium]|nr:hypothetical protein [Woeseiaceae bacterium]